MIGEPTPGPSGAHEGGPTITIIIHESHVALLDPPLESLVPLLEDRRRSFVPGGPTGCRQVERTIAAWGIDFRGRMAFPAGLVPRVRAALEADGYVVRIDDRRRPGPRFRAEDHALEALGPGDRALVAAVRREPLGRIEVDGPRAAVATCVLIARSFPRARIVLAVATRRQARELRRELERRLREHVGLGMAGVGCAVRCLVVCTFGSFDRRTEGRWDVLLLPDAGESAGAKAAEMASATGCRRLYVLVDPRRPADRHEQFALEEMAGAVIHRLERPTDSVRVILVPTPTGPTVAGGLTALEAKRAMYWNNAPRNAFIAAVAAAIAGGDETALRRLGLGDVDERPEPGGEPIRIVVLVESTEHGRQLLALLPGWELRFRSSSPTDPTALAGPAIVTMVASAATGIRADVLIRATGGPWPLRAPGISVPSAPGSRRGSLLIDLDDRHGPRAIEDTRRRVLEYGRDGIEVVMTEEDGH